MKKFISLQIVLILLGLCSCEPQRSNTDTRLLLDTLVTLTAETDLGTLDDAFELCSEYERLLSRTSKDGEVAKINSADDFLKVSKDTLKVIEKGIYYSALSNGKFDITVCSVSSLWDFENQIVPERREIAEALKSVDYEQLEIKDGMIKTNGAKIDLGAVAKGYIADKLTEFFKAEGVKKGTVNLGGNVVVFGEGHRDVDIKNPFKKDENIITLSVENRSVVTSGTYERSFQKDGVFYHHILDSSTGFPCDTDLVSATVISEKSVDGDALSTCCILLGLEKARRLIDGTDDTEAVFITKDEKVYVTKGLERKDGRLHLK